MIRNHALGPAGANCPNRTVRAACRSVHAGKLPIPSDRCAAARPWTEGQNRDSASPRGLDWTRREGRVSPLVSSLSLFFRFPHEILLYAARISRAASSATSPPATRLYSGPGVLELKSSLVAVAVEGRLPRPPPPAGPLLQLDWRGVEIHPPRTCHDLFLLVSVTAPRLLGRIALGGWLCSQSNPNLSRSLYFFSPFSWVRICVLCCGAAPKSNPWLGSVWFVFFSAQDQSSRGAGAVWLSEDILELK
jgi:hypothetical protein